MAWFTLRLAPFKNRRFVDLYRDLVRPWNARNATPRVPPTPELASRRLPQLGIWHYEGIPNQGCWHVFPIARCRWLRLPAVGQLRGASRCRQRLRGWRFFPRRFGWRLLFDGRPRAARRLMRERARSASPTLRFGWRRACHFGGLHGGYRSNGMVR